MPISQGTIGPVLAIDGQVPPGGIRQGRQGEVILSGLHGRYYEQGFRKNAFTVYVSGISINVVGSAMAGLQVFNASPVTNGVNVVLFKVGGEIIVTFSLAQATSLALATGVGQTSAPTITTAATRVSNNFISGPAPQATTAAVATFTNAPTVFMNLMHNTAAIAGTGEGDQFSLDLEGSIIIPPQAYVAIAAVGNPIAVAGSNLYMMWEEVPI